MEVFAKRINLLPPYFFKKLDALKLKYKEALIDFGEGNPDLPPPKNVIKALKNALNKLENHRYPKYQGELRLREAISEWYDKRFKVKLDPEKEIAVVIGCKEGAAHLIWGVCDKDDVYVTTDPAFPIYHNNPLLVGAKIYTLPLKEENNFLPDLDDLKKIRKIKLLCINFPNNPTTAFANLDFYKELIALAAKYGFFIVNDNVYSEIYFEEASPSILQIKGAKDFACEFHSFSKTFNLAGWRIGFLCGNRNLIKAMLRIKENVDSGPFTAIQEAGIYALKYENKYPEKLREIYLKRQNLLLPALLEYGFEIKKPKATFYLWAKLPKKEKSSLKFALKLLKEKKILAAPGSGFGKYGEGYLRFSLTVKDNLIKEAISRLK
ncbi:MAG: aminotransferase class I/II-fold pyridoxal phosphate-dependent enzyme [candidate division WOR-3 bacterium]|nr:aminotransferase class I/II-fold pyridoxal phosphate-dependent enzyme [candidate division WOR-3 bacterium]